MYKIIVIASVSLFLSFTAIASEKVTGRACYKYSNEESINQAKDIALSMAKRDALEKHPVFIEGTSSIKDGAFRNKLIGYLTTDILFKLEITDQEEQVARKKVCTRIKAELIVSNLKNNIVAHVNRYRQENKNISTGLPENFWGKVLKTSIWEGFLLVTLICKERYSYPKVMITHYDSDGIPDYTNTQEATKMSLKTIQLKLKKNKLIQDGYCRPKEVKRVILPLPNDSSYTYSFDLVNK